MLSIYTPLHKVHFTSYLKKMSIILSGPKYRCLGMCQPYKRNKKDAKIAFNSITMCPSVSSEWISSISINHQKVYTHKHLRVPMNVLE